VEGANVSCHHQKGQAMRAILPLDVRERVTEIVACFCAYIHDVFTGGPTDSEMQEHLRDLGVSVVVSVKNTNEGNKQ
jgi:hypothetical protein